MPEVFIAPDQIHQIAEQFRKGSKDSQKINIALDTAMTQLESKWRGAAQQMFYKDYELWKENSQSLTAILANVADQLDAIAERFAAADE